MIFVSLLHTHSEIRHSAFVIRDEIDLEQIALKLAPLMEKKEKRIVQVLDECFEKGKG